MGVLAITGIVDKKNTIKKESIGCNELYARHVNRERLWYRILKVYFSK